MHGGTRPSAGEAGRRTGVVGLTGGRAAGAQCDPSETNHPRRQHLRVNMFSEAGLG